MSNRAPLNLDTHAVFPVITAHGVQRIMAAVGHPLANKFSETLLQRWLDEIATTTIYILLSPDPKGKTQEYEKLLGLLEDYQRRAAALAYTSLPAPKLPDRWLDTAQSALAAPGTKGRGRWKDRHSEYFFSRMAGLLAAAFGVVPTPTTNAAGTRSSERGSRAGDFARFAQATQKEMLRYVDGFEADDRFPDVQRLLVHWSQPEPKTLEKQLEDALRTPLHQEEVHFDWPRPPDLSESPSMQWQLYREMYLRLSSYAKTLPN